MFNDLLIKADQQKEVNETKKARKEEVLNLFKSLAEKAELELSYIFQTIRIFDGYHSGNIAVRYSVVDPKRLSINDLYAYVIDIYHVGNEPFLRVGSGSQFDQKKIPFSFDMTNTQLTILYNNALRAMVARALQSKAKVS